MRETRRDGWWRRGAPLVVVAVGVAACSGGRGDGTTTETSSVATGEEGASAATTDVATTQPSPATSVATSSSTSAPSTTSTVPPPETLPLGAVWTSTPLEVGTSTTVAELAVVGDELWAVGARWNGPVAWRTTDGVQWTEVPVQGPPDSGAVSLAGIVERPGGGYLAWGHAGSSCQADIERDGGYREVGFCRRSRPVVLLSDDGAAWRRIDPPPMQPAGDVSVFVDDLTAVADGFVAVGTHRGPDWYGMVWFSPDGESWEVVRELRGPDGPMSGHEVLWDGSTLVLLAHEHPCSQGSINDNSPGWILGPQWAEHLRMFAGPSVAELTQVAPEDHPLVEQPMAVDCSVDDGFFLAMEPYPNARGAVIGGHITLLDDSVLPEPEEETQAEETQEEGDDAEEPINPRRLVTLADGSWTETIVDGFERGDDLLVEVDGRPALVRSSNGGVGRELVELVLREDGGEVWTSRTAERPILGDFVRVAAGFGDSVILVVPWYSDPYAAVRIAGDPLEMLVWSTREVREDEVTRCTPAAGEVCRLADFSALDAYPDLAGVDYGGADLMFADLRAGDYTGASFVGSILSGATADTTEGGSFVGADFTGADLRGADLEDVAGANLSGADLSSATIGFSAAPSALDGTILVGTRLEVIADAAGEYAAIELALAGFDLTRTRINGPAGDGEVRLVVSDLRGAVLDATSFYAVDLTGVQLDAGVDLAEIDVWDNSLCPDGEPPTDGPIGTCVRP